MRETGGHFVWYASVLYSTPIIYHIATQQVFHPT